MGALFSALVVAAVIAWLWRRRAASGGGMPVDGDGSVGRGFRVVFRAGRRVEASGRIPRNVLHAFEDVAAHASLDGEVRQDASGALSFSDGIPHPVRQQLRNAYYAGTGAH